MSCSRRKSCPGCCAAPEVGSAPKPGRQLPRITCIVGAARGGCICRAGTCTSSCAETLAAWRREAVGMAGWGLYGRNSAAQQRTAGVSRQADEQQWHTAALLPCSVSWPARSPAYASPATKPATKPRDFWEPRSPASACGTAEGRVTGPMEGAGDRLTAAARPGSCEHPSRRWSRSTASLAPRQRSESGCHHQPPLLSKEARSGGKGNAGWRDGLGSSKQLGM